MAIDPDGVSAKKSNFISRSVQQANTLLVTITALQQMIEEADVLNLAAIITDPDFVGDNNHIDRATLVAFYASAQAIIALLEANSNAHLRNLYNMKRG